MKMATTIPSPVESAQFSFSAFDHFSEAVSDWDLEWKQLDRGPLEAKLLQIAGAKTQILRVAFSRQFLQRGSAPKGSQTFGLVGETDGDFEWCRDRCTHNDLLIFKAEGEYESVSEAGFYATALSIEDSYFDDVASILGLCLNREMLASRTTATQLDPKRMIALRHRLQCIGRAVETASEGFATHWLRNQLEFEIPALLIHTLASGMVEDTPEPAGIRARAARTAREFIDACADTQPTIPEVCRSAGVSLRTLNYAFREFYDMTAKEYLQAIRLDGVRRDLHRASPETSISDVANIWGFWHMGQFAADYRRHFAELPSETRRRII
jgi:AraC-like DNA-binding protein